MMILIQILQIPSLSPIHQSRTSLEIKIHVTVNYQIRQTRTIKYVLNKQVGNSQTTSNSNINLNEQYTRHNYDDIDTDSTDAKFIANTSIKNISRDKKLGHDNLLNSTNKNYKIGIDCNVSKEKKCQAISPELHYSSLR